MFLSISCNFQLVYNLFRVKPNTLELITKTTLFLPAVHVICTDGSLQTDGGTGCAAYSPSMVLYNLREAGLDVAYQIGSVQPPVNDMDFWIL